MPERFVIGDETTHVVGDAQPGVPGGVPGGVPMRRADPPASGEEDAAGTDWPTTQCDHCGRPEEEFD
jgi:hypothetical protein